MVKSEKKITCNTTFQDYIEVDNELYTTGFPADDDIVKQLCTQPEDPVLSGTDSDGDRRNYSSILQSRFRKFFANIEYIFAN